MTFLIGGANSASGGYNIDNSLRFNDDDSAYLSRTPSSASNRKTWTWSGWVKRGNISLNMVLFSADDSTGHGIYLDTSDKLYLTKSGVGNYGVEAQLRDVSAWYHIVVAVDTTQTGMSNIVKFYINGVQHTASGTTLYSTDEDTNINNNSVHNIGRFSKNSSYYYDGYLSEVNFVDGSQLTPSSFGETNDNGVWIPKAYSGSYGTNGFFLEFQQTGTSQNSSGMGADTSGNTNHFAVNNLTATDVTTDTPTNNFATLNPLSSRNATLSEGNVEGIRTSSGSSFSAVSTIAPSNGKWYFEYENTGAQNSQVAIVNLDVWPSGTDLYNFPVGESAAVAIESNANYNITFGQDASNGTTLQNSTDLVTAKYGFAVDIDNNDLYLSANGNWYTGSAFDNTDFSNATAVTTDLPSNAPLAFAANGSLANTFYINFGNPGGDDSITSGNADANGYGNFEYAVPSGYYSLCTKNLAEFG